jgi:hypothetical protein
MTVGLRAPAQLYRSQPPARKWSFVTASLTHRIVAAVFVAALASSALVGVMAVPAGASTGTAPVTNVVTDNSSGSSTNTWVPVLFTATVTDPSSSGTPTGSVTWSVSGSAGATTCNDGANPFSAGGGDTATAACEVFASAPGTIVVSESYSGDQNYAAAPSNADTIGVLIAPTNVVSDSATDGTVDPGTTVDFIAQVTDPTGSTVPTGSVNWTVGGSTGVTTCNTAVGPLVASDSDTASAYCEVTTSTPGSIVVSESYSGDSIFAQEGSNTATVSNAVPLITPTNEITDTGTNGISASATVYFYATVADPTDTGNPSGSVTWSVGGSAGATSCNLIEVPLSSNGNDSSSAYCAVLVPGSGTIVVSDSYSGDSTYAAVVSSPDTVTYTAPLTVPNTGIYDNSSAGTTTTGTAITFTAWVVGFSDGGSPTGSFAWSVSGSAGALSCDSSTTTLNAGPDDSASATCTVTPQAVGTIVVGGSYGGDSNYAGVVSNTDTVSVTPALIVATDVVSDNSSGGTIATGTPVTFTAEVADFSFAGTPSGSVTWSVSGSAGALSCDSSTTTLSPGADISATATCTVTPQAPGTIEVSATYSGDSYYAPAVSSTDTVTAVGAALISPINFLSNEHGANTAASGTTVTFLAALFDPTQTGTPTGSVTWQVSGSAGVASCNEGSTTQLVVNQGGTMNATCEVAATGPGTIVVSESYGGDVSYTVAASNTQTVTVSAPVVLPPPPVTPPTTPAANGYDMVGSDGGVFALGSATYEGSLPGDGLHVNDIVGLASTPDGKGYWLVGRDGGVFAFGTAAFDGSMGGAHLNQPIVGMQATPDGGGYWLVGADGGIYSFGNAAFYGSTGSMRLNQPIVGMAATPNGQGYWLVASDGGIFAFGNAQFFGSTGSTHLNKPIVGMAVSPSGDGYWLVAADGGVFNYGAAGFYGSGAANRSATPVIALVPAPDGLGYSTLSGNGGVASFGGASSSGSLPASGVAVADVVAATPMAST